MATTREPSAGNVPQPSFLALFRNGISIVGLGLALISAAFHVILLVITLSEDVQNPYISLWFYLVLPPTIVIGFVLAIVGAVQTRRRFRKLGTLDTFLWRKKGRKLLLFGVPVLVLFVLPFVGFTSYTGYRYTDSQSFCGTACHVPMEPDYVAHLVSPHSKVGCTECHVGEGASAYVRSKLGGIRQLYHVLNGSFERPIPTPIENLRPADETCESCHWSDRPRGREFVELPRFAPDETNTPRPVRMMLKGGDSQPGKRTLAGIHWHTASNERLEYIAADRKRTEIPWVRLTETTETGTMVRVYRSDGLDSDAPLPEGRLRTMDCVDCHNRPAHRFLDPDTIVSQLLSSGWLDRSLPYLKREACRALVPLHKDRETGLASIREHLTSFYAENYPDLAEEKAESIEQAVAALQDAHRKNIFPEMRVNWKTHADHRGHKIFAGCFRCHDDRHVASDGAVISRDCTVCHEFLEEREVDGETLLVRGEYHHPFELEGAHLELNCMACHDGSSTESPECRSCHGEVDRFMAGTFDLLPGLVGPASPKVDLIGCTDCHDGAQRFAEAEIGPSCTECHEDEYSEKADGWMKTLAEARANVERRLEDPGLDAAGREDVRQALQQLDRIRPLHNFEYALKVLRQLAGAAPEAGTD